MKGIKGLTFLGIILVVVGLIGIVTTYNHEQETVSDIREIPELEINHVDIHSENVKVEIITADNEPPRVELSGTNSKGSKYKFNLDVSDGTLSVELKERMSKLYSFDFRATGLNLKVYLPEKEYESLKVMNGNGKVTMNNLHAKDINAKISNGYMDISNIKSPQLTVEADNGRLNIAHVEAEAVHSKTDNGKITMKDVSGNIIGKTNNGIISLITHDLERGLELETDNGIINIETDEKPKNVRFEVNVDNGKVNILDEFKGSTVIGNGDNLIKLTAHNGSINVK